MPRLFITLLLAALSTLARAEDVVRVYNWINIIDPQILVEFEKETGIRVDYNTFSTPEELKAILTDNNPVDVTVPAYENLPSLIKDGRLVPLDFSLLPNRQHVDTQLLSKLAALDLNNRYAVPYLWGAVGLAINTPLAEKAFGGPLPQSWSLLFDPEQSKRLSQCGISILDSPNEVLAVLLNYQGYNFVRSAPSRIRRSAELLKALRPNLAYLDNQRYTTELYAGRLCVAMAWTGDAMKAVEAGQPMNFIVPEEGSVMFIDSLAISAKAKRVDLAHKFIDFMLRPEVAAKISSSSHYPNANADARPFMEEILREHPSLYPDKAVKRRLFPMEPVPEKLAATRDEVWAAFQKAR